MVAFKTWCRRPPPSAKLVARVVVIIFIKQQRAFRCRIKKPCSQKVNIVYSILSGKECVTMLLVVKSALSKEASSPFLFFLWYNRQPRFYTFFFLPCVVVVFFSRFLVVALVVGDVHLFFSRTVQGGRKVTYNKSHLNFYRGKPERNFRIFWPENRVPFFPSVTTRG